MRNTKIVEEEVGPIKDANGRFVSDCKNVAVILNSFFHSMFITEDISSLPNVNHIFTGSENMLKVEEIHKNDGAKCLRNLDPNKSTGADQISAKLLRECQDELVLPLKLLFSRSQRERFVPDTWKCANVTPIFKKGSKWEAGNYRHIILASVVIKLTLVSLQNA